MSKYYLRRLRNRYSNTKFILFVKRYILHKTQKKYTFNPEILEGSCDVPLQWTSPDKKPIIGLVKDYSNLNFVPFNSYWPRFEKFLNYNSFETIIFNINESNWIENVKKCDVIVYRTPSEHYDQYESKMKVWFIENILKKKVLPSYNHLWYYEDKIAQYYLLKELNLPVIDTFISFSYEESINYIKNCEYPFVSKITTGSGSLGVEIIKSRRKAERVVRKIFTTGYRTAYSYLKQKNYVYFQKYIKNCEYDLRVIVIGNKLFGYYRYTPKNDFRASGAGLVVKKEIPVIALDFAYNVSRKLDTPFIAIDLLKENFEDKFFINEVSIFIQIETDEQLHVNGKPGFYERIDEGVYAFKEGKFWIQELMLEEFLRREYFQKKG